MINYKVIDFFHGLSPLKGYLWFLKDEKECILIKFDYTDILNKEEIFIEPDNHNILATNWAEFVWYIESYRPIKFLFKRYDNFLFISDLVISTEYTRQWIGSNMIKMIKSYAKEKKFDWLMTQTETVNFPAQKLYEKNWFIECGTHWIESYPYKELDWIAFEYHFK